MIEGTLSEVAVIRDLNDRFRQRFIGGQVFITAGVQALGSEFVRKAFAIVQSFDTFTEDNDPHGEHDFGSFTLESEKLYWKIDYYDRALRMGSSNAADPAVTTRVLTVLLASEW